VHRLLVIGATTLAALVLGGPAGAWTWPADGAVLRPFTLGPDAYAAGQHRGIDVGGEEGSPVRAPAAGTVAFAGSLPTHGRGVTILTSDGYAVTLVHLGSITVAKGDSVDEGAPVGTMGFSGEPEHAVPSVHLGIRVASQAEGYVDPIGLLPTRPAAAPAAPPTPAPAPAPVAAPAPPSAQPAPAPVSATPSVTPQPTPSAPTAPPLPIAEPGPTSTLPVAASAPSPPADVPGSTVAADGHASDQPGSTPPTTSPTAAPAGSHTASEERSAAAPAQETSLSVGNSTALDVGAPAPAAALHTTRRPADIWVPGRPAGVETLVDGPVPARDPEAIAGPGPEPRVDRVGAQAEVAAFSSEAADPATEESTVEQRRDLWMDGRPLEGSSKPAARSASDGVPVRGRSVRAIPGAAVGSTVAHVVAGTAAEAAGGSAPHIGVIAATVALIVLLAVAASMKAARRIDGNGAVLPDNTDLLRQLDAAHRPRIHDGRGGRLCTPSTAARS
jgi:Peptidase family M23